MNSQRFYRALRKVIRPLRRRLQTTGEQASLDEFDSPTLILIAHPDDEVFCSGLICELIRRDRVVHLVCFTRGEGGERGEIPAESKLSQIREQELRSAAETLGISKLTILEYLDPVSNDGKLLEPDYDSNELLNELESYIKQHSIGHLLTHGSSGEYWHPAHLCLHKNARILNRRLPQLQLWTFNAWKPNHLLPAVLNQDDPAHLNYDGAQHHEKRLQSLRCHYSQKNVFERFSEGSLADFITQTSIESFRKW